MKIKQIINHMTISLLLFSAVAYGDSAIEIKSCHVEEGFIYNVILPSELLVEDKVVIAIPEPSYLGKIISLPENQKKVSLNQIISAIQKQGVEVVVRNKHPKTANRWRGEIIVVKSVKMTVKNALKIALSHMQEMGVPAQRINKEIDKRLEADLEDFIPDFRVVSILKKNQIVIDLLFVVEN